MEILAYWPRNMRTFQGQLIQQQGDFPMSKENLTLMPPVSENTITLDSMLYLDNRLLLKSSALFLMLLGKFTSDSTMTTTLVTHLG